MSASICENLKDALAKREGAGIEVLDNIGPMGELQLPGNRFKPLQVVQVSCPRYFLGVPQSIVVISARVMIIKRNFRSTVSK